MIRPTTVSMPEPDRRAGAADAITGSRVELQLLTTLKCNLKCSYCSLGVGEVLGSQQQVGYDLDQLERFVATQLAGKEIYVTFYGGEPTLNRDFIAAAMHLGYAWLVVALALRAAAELSGVLPATAWLHAFNVGALGMMMLGLMTRVTLHHTGRPLLVPPLLRAGYLLMFAAAVLRVTVALRALDADWLALSMLLWASPFAIYLALFGAMLWRPSLPR